MLKRHFLSKRMNVHMILVIPASNIKHHKLLSWCGSSLPRRAFCGDGEQLSISRTGVLFLIRFNSTMKICCLEKWGIFYSTNIKQSSMKICWYMWRIYGSSGSVWGEGKRHTIQEGRWGMARILWRGCESMFSWELRFLFPLHISFFFFFFF